MSLSGSLSGRVGAFGAAAAAVFIRSGLTKAGRAGEMAEAAAYMEPEEPAIRNGHPDFGTWLWDRPVRLVKIDRGVIALLGNAVDQNGEGAAAVIRAGRLLTSVLAVGADRDLPVVAKGIEEPEQLARLMQLGCRAGQGFLFARPMDPADAEAYLRRRRILSPPKEETDAPLVHAAADPTQHAGDQGRRAQ